MPVFSQLLSRSYCLGKIRVVFGFVFLLLLFYPKWNTLFFSMFINTKFHNLCYFVTFKQTLFLNKDDWVSGFSAPPILVCFLKLFVCFLCVTPNYRWLGGIYYFVLSYVVCARICIPSHFHLAPFFLQI